MKKNMKEKALITLTDINIGSSIHSFSKFLEYQKDLFHSQIHQLQNIVVTQCRLTAVNPLSQEMAAGALSINIGKRPRDLLNPKAVKLMQSVFSIKDTITKKETREISALCGVTITQVREYFAGQRSRVRKLVRLSREKAVKSDVGKTLHGGCSTSSDPAMHAMDQTTLDTMVQNPLNTTVQTPLNTMDPNAITPDAGQTSQGECSSSDPSMHVINPTPLNSVDPRTDGEGPSCSSKQETIPGADDFEKKFIENIFNMMRKEVTFSGQAKLMEWILQIQNSSVLYWFVTKGGLMMLVAWLSEAALEEQTTVLLVVFQVLCHLPLHKAQPAQMSAILQTVNRLRFYRTSDISNRAKVLLSRWSKLFVRSHALKRPSSTPVATQKEKSLWQSDISTIEWHANLDLPEEILSLALESSESFRKSEPLLTQKLLQASSDDSSKNHTRNVSSTQTKERRKVQLMEHPGRNTTARSSQVPRAIPTNQGRPMSADDIQKAKMRASFMQSKYGKGVSSNESRLQKTRDLKNSSISQISSLSSTLQPPVIENRQLKTGLNASPNSEKTEDLNNSSNSPLSPLSSPSKLPVNDNQQLKTEGNNNSPNSQISQFSSPLKPPLSPIVEEHGKPMVVPSETCRTPPEPSMDSKPSLGPEESPLEKLNRNRIPWHMPPEMGMNSHWGVGVGENSKEVEIQTGRIRREKETIYQRMQDIPPNPKDPWDLEMDYDDTLTPLIPIEQAPEEVPTEQVPEAYETEVSVPPRTIITTSVPPAVPKAAPVSFSENAPEPDLELLAVLLKNPELVFALTSGQGGNFSSAETVQLLDMIKNSGGSLTGVLNGLNGNIKEEPASLPSPTPHSASLPSPTPHSFPSPTPMSLPSPTPPSERGMNGWRSEASNNSFQQPVSVTNREAYFFPQVAPNVPSPIDISATGLVQHQSHATKFTQGLTQLQSQATNFTVPQPNQELRYNNLEYFAAGLNRHSVSVASQERQLLHMNQSTNLRPYTLNPPQAAAYQNLQPELMSFGQISLQHETVNYGQMQTVKPAPTSVVPNLPDGTPVTFPPTMTMQPTHQSPSLPEQSFMQHMHQPMLQWDTASSSRQTQMNDTRGGRHSSYDASGSNPWSQSNQNNYNSFHGEAMQPSVPDHSNWDRNEFVDEQDFETYSPRKRSRSPDYHSGRSFSDSRRDRGRNSKPDLSRRRDSSRRDHSQGNRGWRDRR
ncbi:hypothetical protein IFM89_015833 [Coptis chinensis]|uniref:Homeobox domain-containing protein n=1 Tax=Coptis chinensis TaxID=261450 RepID=A0A835MEN6_9MAGN|nr:hypothetical protein IFM89_015833 [Coptis chinensis]